MRPARAIARSAALVALTLANLAQAEPLEAVVAARMIQRGETIGHDALMLVPVRSLPGPAYVGERSEALGMIAGRTIVRGRLVPRSVLREADHVEKGASLRLIYRAGTLTLAVPATALGPGRIGGTLPVRVPETGLRTTARVLSTDTAEVLR